MDTICHALDYHAHGLAVLPIPHAEKIPTIKWQRYQNVGPSTIEVRQLFADADSNIAIVCGRPSSNLIVLDCDNAATYADVATKLAAEKISTWSVQRPPNGSPHDGGGHYYLRTPAAVKTAKIGDIDVRGQGAYVLAPPSLHPNGGVYTFTQPGSIGIYQLPALDALDWLKLTAAQPARHIPALAWKILSGDRATIAQYSTRSEAEAAICASLAQAGFDFFDALGLFIKHPGAGKFADMYVTDPQNAQRWLSLTWHKVNDWIAAQSNPALDLAEQCEQYALSTAWPGRSGSTDRAVYLAHTEIVQRCGKSQYDASVRELAELSGMTWKTVANANKRLIDAGLLKLVSPSKPSYPCIYELCANLHIQSLSNVNVCVNKLTNHDAFRNNGGLGKSGSEIWGLLAAGEKTERELEDATGRHRTTVKKKLMAMLRLGMVEPLGDGLWRAVADIDLDDIAKLLGTDGTAEAQHAKHVQERRAQRFRMQTRGNYANQNAT